MATMIFVHGTGVRGAAFKKSYELIAPRIRSLGHEPAECLWGDEYGSKFTGAALPGHELQVEQERIALWAMLLQDPFAELKLAEPSANASGGGVVSPGEIIWERLLNQVPGTATIDALERLELAPFWQYAFDSLTQDADQRWKTLVERAAENNGMFEQAIARCLLAQLILSAEALWMLPPDATDRDALADLIVADLGGSARGIAGSALKFALGLFTPVATPILRWTRDGWSAGVSPAIGDVLMYQARGEKIRQYIKTRIEAQKGPVILLAHSLGGIAAVDLLLRTDLPQVHALVTVGSQSPYLYEINALTGLEKGAPWPARFPAKWLNIHDTNDFLSYPGEGILSGRVQDLCCPSGQPFPESHSAYWRNDAVWEGLKTFLRKDGI